jgi:LAGLIDADG DNA endonuclease family protein
LVAKQSKTKTYQPSYLAGLIEGDGSIYVPDNLRNDKGQLIQANIEIIFTINDLSLANLIIKKIGGGYLIKNDNYVRLFIKNKSSLLQLINLINSYP